MLQFHAPGRWKDVVRLQFAPDSCTIVGGCFGYGVAIWDVYSGAVRSQYRLNLGSVFGLLVSAHHGFVCVPSAYDGLVHLSYPELHLLSPHLPGEAGYVQFAALSPDNSRVVRSAFTTVGQPIPYGIAMVAHPPAWDEQLWQQFDPAWVPRSVTFLASGQTIVTADTAFRRDGASRLAVRDAVTGRVLREVSCPAKELKELVAAENGRWLLLLAGRTIWVWSVDDWSATPKKILNDARPHFTGVAFHPSGQHLAATSNDTTVKLYDTATWQVAKTFTWNVGRLRSIAFSPDGMLAAVGSDTGKIVVWDVDL